MATLDQIDTIVVVLMENQSFDHMLGVQSRAVTLGIGGWGEVSELDFIQL
jgi:phospholipase C